MKYIIMIWNAADYHLPGAYPDDIVVFEGEDLGKACNIAYEMAIENYHSYGGMYGLVLEGDDCDTCEGVDPDCDACEGTGHVTRDYANEVMEGTINYAVEIYNPATHNPMFKNLNMEIPK